MEKPNAIIFDYDGVIVDSLDVQWLAYCGANQTGFDRMEILKREGKTARQITKEITDKEGEELDKAVEKKRELYSKWENRIDLFPEAIELLEELKEKEIKIGMATGTIRKNVEDKLEDKTSFFDAITTSEDYEKMKPDPEPYLQNAKKLGEEPEDCWVIENAPLGIKAAKNAGMKCIAVTTTLPEEYLNEADEVIDNLKEVKEWI